MKKIATAVFVTAWFIASAQLHDAQWVIGPVTSAIDFRNDTVTNRLIENSFWTFRTNADICDENGNLLSMTNGIFISDANGTEMLNENDLNPCPYTTQYANQGLNINQAALFLPKPGDKRYYYLFHFSNDTLDNTRPGTL